MEPENPYLTKPMDRFLGDIARLSADQVMALAGAVKPSPVGDSSPKIDHPSLWWNTLSNLQKAIRRGDVGQARTSTTRLYIANRGKLVRRLCVIALEDVAFGDIELVAKVIGYAALRKIERKSVVWLEDLGKCLTLAEAMARSVKDRSACELAVASTWDAAHVDAVRRGTQFASAVCAEIYRDETCSLSWRCVAGWSLIGKPVRNHERLGTPNREALTAALHGMKLPDAIIFIAEKALAFGAEVAGLGANIPILYARMAEQKVQVRVNPLPRAELIRGLLSMAYDKHTRVGLRALAGYRTHCRELREFLRDIGVDARRVVGNLAFMSEGSVVDREIRCPLGDELYTLNEQAQCAAIGLPHSALPEAKQLFLGNLATLNEFRRSAAASEIAALNG